MTLRRSFTALGLLSVLSVGVTTLVAAENGPRVAPTQETRSSEVAQAHQKFTKLLIPEGSQKAPALKRRTPVVNAFGSGPGTAANPGGGRGK